MIRIIGFYREYEEYGCFSNWYKADFEYAGKKFISAEQYMMYHKMIQFGAFDVAERILNETDQGTIKSLGRTKLDSFDPKLWDKTKYAIVKRGIRAKFMQNPELLQQLLDTGNALLAECSKNDKQWGIGIDITDESRMDTTKWHGQNLLGRILMEIRQELELRRFLGKLEYADHRDDSTCPYWEMTLGELKRHPHFYSSVHAYTDYLNKGEIDEIYGKKLSEIENIIRKNMGRGLLSVGFWELKQDVFELSELLETPHSETLDKADIHSFAVRFYDMFNDPKADYLKLENDLGKDCGDLGFDMDAGESFIEQYSKDAFHKADTLERIINDVDSVDILCNGIYSKWRYITHWAGVTESLLSEENKKWFLIALTRLAELTS